VSQSALPIKHRGQLHPPPIQFTEALQGEITHRRRALHRDRRRKTRHNHSSRPVIISPFRWAGGNMPAFRCQGKRRK